MLEAPIRRTQRGRYLAIALLAVTAVVFSSCATEKKRTALIGDPDSRNESSIPWNKPAKWESGANVPGGIGGTGGNNISN
ncbi:MAG: hypothetical protein ABI787_12055 [Spartobacteria bacterium]